MRRPQHQTASEFEFKKLLVRFSRRVRFAALARGFSMRAMLRCAAFCTFTKARTSIWRTRSRDTPNSPASSSSVIGSSASRRASKMRPDQVKLIAKRLGVTEQDVIDMNRRLGGDASLNTPIREDGNSGEWMDWLVDDSASQESRLAESEQSENRHKALSEALTVLNDRERRRRGQRCGFWPSAA